MIFNGASEKIIQKILSGLVKVGDADKLDGQDSGYYAPAAEYRKWHNGSCTNFDTTLTRGKYSVGGKDLTGAPYSGTVYGTLYVEIANDKTEGGVASVWLTQIFIGTDMNIYVRQNINGSGFTDWECVFTTAGGTIDGAVTVMNGASVKKARAEVMGIYNTNGTTVIQGYYGVDGLVGFIGIHGGQPYFIGVDNVYKAILHSGNYSKYAVPLNNGTTIPIINTDAGTPLILNNITANNYCGIQYRIAGEKVGYIGFRGGFLQCEIQDGVWEDILHTGNSAKTIIGDTAPSDTTALWIDTST